MTAERGNVPEDRIGLQHIHHPFRRDKSTQRHPATESLRRAEYIRDYPVVLKEIERSGTPQSGLYFIVYQQRPRLIAAIA